MENIDFRKVENLFSQAFLLINTSIFEGFPNTFLQAGKHGIPLLSLQVDPDGFIEKYECGKVVRGNLSNLAEGLKQMAFGTEFWHQCSENIKQYVRSHHEVNDKVKELHQILEKFVGEDDGIGCKQAVI
jgi:glycosyltransferase involved in cell wall biosynthesis